MVYNWSNHLPPKPSCSRSTRPLPQSWSHNHQTPLSQWQSPKTRCSKGRSRTKWQSRPQQIFHLTYRRISYKVWNTKMTIWKFIHIHKMTSNAWRIEDVTTTVVSHRSTHVAIFSQSQIIFGKSRWLYFCTYTSMYGGSRYRWCNFWLFYPWTVLCVLATRTGTSVNG